MEIDVLRPADSLRLQFQLINFILVEGPILLRADASQPAYIEVGFGPQHLAEPADDDGGPFPGVEPARLAGPSRLVFQLPDGLTQFPASLDALMEWDTWLPSLAPVAVAPGPAPPGLPELRAPTAQETAIELPYRLVLSPDSSARWAHASRPVERGRRVELWHTRTSGNVRAVWSPDFQPDPNAAPPEDRAFTTTLTALQRHQLVHQSADFALSRRAGEVPIPIDATIMLSATGGWLRAAGDWSSAGAGLGLTQWEHRATEGRDHYVRTVEKGVLLPFGHPAAYVTIAERKVLENPADAADPDRPKDLVAALRSRRFIVILEPDRHYQEADYEHAGREFPFFGGVRFTSAVTPDSDSPQQVDGAFMTFWVRREGSYLQFSLEGTDHESRVAPFSAPCLFVGQTDLEATGAQTAVERYLTTGDEAARAAAVGLHRVAFARAPDSEAIGDAGGPGNGGDPGGLTDVVVSEIALSVQEGSADSVALPEMSSAIVGIPALDGLGASTSARITLHPLYLQEGLGSAANALQLFANVADSETAGPLAFRFPADRSAGLATPSIAVDGLSRLRGPVGDAAGLAGGTFEPAKFFGDAKLLGGVGLADLIRRDFDAEQLPRVVSTRLPAGAAVPTSTVTTFQWTPAVAANGSVPIVTWQEPPAGVPQLNLQATTQTSTGGSSSAAVDATLRAFTINIPSSTDNYVAVAFDELHCELPAGGKPHVTATLASNPLTFGGPLSFVNELQQYLPADGFSDPPSLDLTPTGLEVGYVLSLPPISVGVFNLQDLSLGASLHLPFTGDPARLRVAFSERAHPCVLTVSLFGGGAFLAIAGGTDGIEAIEGALEFGGSFALDIVVASGGVTVMAGVYFKYDRTASPDLTLAGYFRASGELSVLGLISVSVDFMLTLTWESTGKVEGEATMTVKVHIAFFSKSVGLRLHKGFGGAAGDPTFGDLMATTDDWAAYVAAFA